MPLESILGSRACKDGISMNFGFNREIRNYRSNGWDFKGGVVFGGVVRRGFIVRLHLVDAVRLGRTWTCCGLRRGLGVGDDRFTVTK